MMQGKLIVIEGIDGSGKSTQYRCLCERLEREGADFRRVTFPRYDEESSALIRAYLRGDFGSRPGDVNAYAASTFYAVDRFASFRTDWGAYYEAGGTVLCDRYTTSNACHQGSKLPEGERQAYLNWLYHFEFDLMGLPKPDLVVYLDIEVETAKTRMAERERATNTSADIHERDAAYLQSCLAAGRAAAAHYGWRVIRSGARSVEDIHEEIYAAVKAATE